MTVQLNSENSSNWGLLISPLPTMGSQFLQMHASTKSKQTGHPTNSPLPSLNPTSSQITLSTTSISAVISTNEVPLWGATKINYQLEVMVNVTEFWKITLMGVPGIFEFATVLLTSQKQHFYCIETINEQKAIFSSCFSELNTYLIF